MNKIEFIKPSMEQVNVNDLWHQGLLLYCKNASNHYTRVTGRRMTMAEIQQFVDAMLMILMEENHIPIKDTE